MAVDSFLGSNPSYFAKGWHNPSEIKMGPFNHLIIIHVASRLEPSKTGVKGLSTVVSEQYNQK